jgi:uncharacterized protein
MRLHYCATVLLAVLLAGCTVSIGKDSVLYTDQRVKNEGKILGGKPAAEAKVGPEYRIAEETLPADFGGVHSVLAASDPAKPLIVFCGGNAFRESTGGAYAIETLSPFGDVFLFDYPGYGGSTGSGTKNEFESELRVIETKVTALAASHTRPVIFWGHSFGGGICANLAAAAPEKSMLVLEGTFADYGDVKNGMLGVYIPALLANYPNPIIVAALTEDEMIAFSVSEKLAEKLKAEGRTVAFVRLEGTGHSKIHLHPEYREKMAKALADSGLK